MKKKLLVTLIVSLWLAGVLVLANLMLPAFVVTCPLPGGAAARVVHGPLIIHRRDGAGARTSRAYTPSEWDIHDPALPAGHTEVVEYVK